MAVNFRALMNHKNIINLVFYRKEKKKNEIRTNEILSFREMQDKALRQDIAMAYKAFN